MTNDFTHQFLREPLNCSESTFLILRDLIHDHTGIYYELEKKEMLTDKLSSRLVEHGFSSFLDYYYLLKYDPGADDEWKQVANSLAVPETFFWREYAQIDSLVNIILPNYWQWILDGKYNLSVPTLLRPLKIWSAACSTGEEPLTIAIALQESGWFDKLPIEISASDASNYAITCAQKGLYRERSFRSIPNKIRDKYFIQEGNQWRISPSIHKRIKWQVANLVEPSAIQNLSKANFIFCRNVFIYFSEDSIRKTVGTFFNQITTPGYLFISSSESLLKLHTGFQLEEFGDALVYVKQSKTEKI